MTRVLQMLPFPSERPRDGGQIRAHQTGEALERAGFTVVRCPIYRAAWHPNSKYQPPVINLDDARITPRYSNIWQVYDLTNGEILAHDADCFAAFVQFLESARPDVLMLEHPWLWPAVKRLPPSLSAPVIYNSYNCEADLKRRILQEAGVNDADIIALEIEGLERELVSAATAVSATTEADAAIYREWTARPVVVAPNGAECRIRTHLRGVLPDIIKPWWRYLLFVASAHPPNGAGFIDLAVNNLASISSDHRVVVAGTVCDMIAEHLRSAAGSIAGSDRLLLLGEVSPVTLDCLIENATGLLLPVTYGGGSNLKTVEALLAGHPIIGTQKAFRGNERFTGQPGIIIAETPEQFGSAMRCVLSGAAPSLPQTNILDSITWANTLQPIVDVVTTTQHLASNNVSERNECQYLSESPQSYFNNKFASTTIEIIGSPAVVFGLPGDEYFEKLPAYAAQNALFVAEAQKVPCDGVIIDVGANIGVTTVLSSRCIPQGRVVAIEPSPLAHACLIRTIAANALTNCTVIQKCAGDVEGKVSFVEAPFLAGSYVDLEPAHEGRSIVVASADAAKNDQSPSTPVLVSMTTIDAIVAELRLQRVDLIKIDVEGFELDVLKGASNTAHRFRPRFVMEFNSFALAANRKLSPLQLLDFVLVTFGSFSTMRSGVLTIIQTPREARDFLYSNMTSAHCVDDILFG